MMKHPRGFYDWKHDMPESLAGRLRFEVTQTLRSVYADEALVNEIDTLYLPFANWLSGKVSLKQGPLVVGLGGPQGCGKTTFCRVISRILNKGFGLNSVVVSLDDLYSTHKDRLKYANSTHSLFSTRGVPGTHDMSLAQSVFARLKSLKQGEVMRVPAFDKSLDDRKPVNLWSEVQGPIDVVLFEGWCVGAFSLGETIDKPINRLEQDKDPEGTWRRAVDEHLHGDYKALFDLIDIQMWMQSPSYDVVYEWRNKQERMLEDHLYDIHGGVLDTLDIKIMSPEALKGFMQYYERLTRYLLAVMPERSDVLFSLDQHQKVKQLRFPIEH
ncbi:Uridine kinase [Marinomonas spartinae]|uniref:Uridine kinase n=1 Tax=Marinomonas spartinae TaxID=1792290 RepID=A0A1A8TQB8_9GAMM|nr:hypothetical protein [Marinomonas spartinae]SBS35044.1 Uridine kinase [Marinomonas spartinae]SBS36516.1 Uridine kinase [Marinomonas spartinae]